MTYEVKPLFPYEACVLGPSHPTDGSRPVIYQGNLAMANTVADALNGAKIMPHIRFLVHTVSSKPDGNGNRYHWCSITSTLTGRTLNVRDIGETNGPLLVSQFLREVMPSCWDAMHCTSATTGYRQWGQSVPSSAVYENHVTADTIRALEQPATEG